MNISISELLNKQPANIIDIRDRQKFLKDHIPGAISIEGNELMNNPNQYLRNDKVYYIYCDSGYKSKRLVQILNRIGYKTVSITGGYNNYLLRE